MSAMERQRAEWLDSDLWKLFEQLESRYRLSQWEYRLAQRELQQVPYGPSEALLLAWLRYCRMVAELDRTTAEIEGLRTRVSRTGALNP
ncbi:MAG: hypothetical protein JO299_04200 [Gammaproteobacteria bacterium]|nr:hypothetical protein [Gammaproteobacteria bacterium]